MSGRRGMVNCGATTIEKIKNQCQKVHHPPIYAITVSRITFG